MNQNSLTLAYVGDAIYEIYIRKHLVINKKITKVNDLQKQAVTYVSARGQASYLKSWLENNILTPTERDVVMRARNHKVGSSPKNTDIVTYKYATGLEALFGYLYLIGNEERLDELASIIVGENICISMEKM